MEKSHTTTSWYAKLGICDLTEDTLYDTVIQSSVCVLYGKSKYDSVNKARHAIFQLNFAPKKDTDPLAKIKGINASCLPPRWEVLQEKTKEQTLSLQSGSMPPVQTQIH